MRGQLLQNLFRFIEQEGVDFRCCVLDLCAIPEWGMWIRQFLSVPGQFIPKLLVCHVNVPQHKEVYFVLAIDPVEGKTNVSHTYQSLEMS